MSNGADILGLFSGEPQSLLLSLLIFSIVFVAVLGFGWRLLTPPKSIGEAPRTRDVRQGSDEPMPEPERGSDKRERAPDALTELRTTLHTGFRVLAFIIVASMALLTAASYFATNPGDGSRLLTIVLAAATLLLAFHLQRIDRRHRPLDSSPVMKMALPGEWLAGPGRKFGVGRLGPATLEWSIASPEVCSIDQATLAQARAMAGEGRPMEEICRMTAPDYDLWDPAQQHAYRAVIQAAMDHSH